MRSSDRRMVRRAIALIRSGDVAGAVATLRPLLREPSVTLAGPVEQLVLDLVLVECRIGGTLPLRDCLTRRSRRYASGGRAGAGGGPRGQPVNLECKGCPLGESYAQRAPGFVPPPQSRPPEVLPPAQRRAKFRAIAENLTPALQATQDDPLAIVASMTPDDREV